MCNSNKDSRCKKVTFLQASTYYSQGPILKFTCFIMFQVHTCCCLLHILTTMLLLLSWSRKYLYLCSCILLLYVVILFVNTKYLTYPTSCKRKIMLEVVCVTTFFLTSDFLWSIIILWTHSRKEKIQVWN